MLLATGNDMDQVLCGNDALLVSFLFIFLQDMAMKMLQLVQRI